MKKETEKQPESMLPKGFQTEGQEVVAGLQKLIEGKPVITVATALVATLFAAVTQDSLERPAREALTVMVHDLLGNVMASNEVSEERLQVLMAQRGGQAVMATAAGSVILDEAAG